MRSIFGNISERVPQIHSQFSTILDVLRSGAGKQWDAGLTACFKAIMDSVTPAALEKRPAAPGYSWTANIYGRRVEILMQIFIEKQDSRNDPYDPYAKVSFFNGSEVEAFFALWLDAAGNYICPQADAPRWVGGLEDSREAVRIWVAMLDALGTRLIQPADGGRG